MTINFTERVSVASDGTQGNGPSGFNPSISRTGRFVAFGSDATNLVPGDTNGVTDIFVHDRETGQTTRVSVASDGTQANSTSFNSSISPGGRFVAFESSASNLVPDDTNGTTDIFVHDRETGQTTRVSVASDGTQANGSSLNPSMIGRFVVFDSFASNLVPSDTNGQRDIFVHDRETGQTTRVSVASDGTQGNGSSFNPSISKSGRFIAFASSSSNLVPNDTNNRTDIFVHDRETGETTRVSVASDGTQANSDSIIPSISPNGRYVAFDSFANNLVPGDTNGDKDIFVHDRETGQTTRVSVASDGTQANNSSFNPSITRGGRFIAFESFATNLVPGDTNSARDIFVHDRETGQTMRVSVASDGTQGNGSSFEPSINRGGRFIVFDSSATNLVPNDTNGVQDVFVRDPLFPRKP